MQTHAKTVSSQNEKPLLQVENISVHYGEIHAIKNISFTVNAGEIVTLLGANGAGKSTTLRSISGLIKSSSGRILFQNQILSGIPPHLIVKKGMVGAGNYAFNIPGAILSLLLV